MCSELYIMFSENENISYTITKEKKKEKKCFGFKKTNICI